MERKKKTIMDTPSLGDQELALLRYVTDHAPLSVREAADQYGEAHHLARTTILTVMERLRKKGYLHRRKEGGVFQYRPAVAKTQLLHSLVGEFVEKTLGGSLSPFVAYLAEAKLPEHELSDLRRLVQEMESDRS